MARELAKVMHARGIFATAESRNVVFEEAGRGEVKHLVAANAYQGGSRYTDGV